MLLVAEQRISPRNFPACIARRNWHTLFQPLRRSVRVAKATSVQTIKDHLDNIRFFTKYLVWYTHSQHRLDEVNDSDVYWFLADWFPRKAL